LDGYQISTMRYTTGKAKDKAKAKHEFYKIIINNIKNIFLKQKFDRVELK
jgi:hypothetical protein